jgi:hypothetical protein
MAAITRAKYDLDLPAGSEGNPGAVVGFGLQAMGSDATADGFGSGCEWTSRVRSPVAERSLSTALRSSIQIMAVVSMSISRIFKVTRV